MYQPLEDEKYFALPHVSQSKLKKLTDLSFAQFQTLQDPEPSDAMRFGHLSHAVNLTHLEVSEIPVIEKPDGRTKAGKEARESLKDTRNYCFPREAWALAQMQKNFNASPEACFLRDKAKLIEHAGIVKVSNSRWVEGMTMKFKPDMVHDNMIVDYKTIGMHVTADSIKKSMRTGQYAFQLACYLYLDGLLTGQQKKDAAIIWQETIEPFGVYVMPLHPETIEFGWQQFCVARDKYLEGLHRPEMITANNRGFIQDPFFKYL